MNACLKCILADTEDMTQAEIDEYAEIVNLVPHAACQPCKACRSDQKGKCCD